MVSWLLRCCLNRLYPHGGFPLNSPFHGCGRRGSTRFAKHGRTLHVSPRICSSLRICRQNIDIGGGEQAVFYSHVSDALSF